jgi:hypothetical protein
LPHCGSHFDSPTELSQCGGRCDWTPREQQWLNFSTLSGNGLLFQNE